MSPKEKAKQLVHNFYDSMNPNAPDCNISYNQSKECALIVVYEIVSLFITDCEDTRYWQEIKQEIEKL